MPRWRAGLEVGVLIGQVLAALATITVPAIGLWVALSYNRAQIAAANNQLVLALVPLVGNEHARTRLLACSLMERFDVPLTVLLAQDLEQDSEPAIQECAARILNRLALTGVRRTEQRTLDQQAKEVLDERYVKGELRARHLDGKVVNANDLIAFGKYDEALAIYRQVVQSLSSEARARLDRRLIERAEEEARQGNLRAAAAAYRAALGD